MTPGEGKSRSIHTLREAITSFLEVSGLSRQTFQDRMGRAWCEIVGLETAKHTRLSRTLRRGVLLVEVDSAALLAELSGFQKTQILTALRDKVKQKYIEDIRFKLGVGP